MTIREQLDEAESGYADCVTELHEAKQRIAELERKIAALELATGDTQSCDRLPISIKVTHDNGRLILAGTNNGRCEWANEIDLDQARQLIAVIGQRARQTEKP